MLRRALLQRRQGQPAGLLHVEQPLSTRPRRQLRQRGVDGLTDSCAALEHRAIVEAAHAGDRLRQEGPCGIFHRDIDHGPASAGDVLGDLVGKGRLALPGRA